MSYPLVFKKTLYLIKSRTVHSNHCEQTQLCNYCQRSSQRSLVHKRGFTVLTRKCKGEAVSECRTINGMARVPLQVFYLVSSPYIMGGGQWKIEKSISGLIFHPSSRGCISEGTKEKQHTKQGHLKNQLTGISKDLYSLLLFLKLLWLCKVGTTCLDQCCCVFKLYSVQFCFLIIIVRREQ